MIEKDFNKIKQALLKDSEIKEYLKKLFTENISTVIDENHSSTETLAEIANLRNKILQLEEHNKNCEKKIAIYESNYSLIEQSFISYKQLSEKTKQRLQNVFRGESVVEFFAGAIQIDNILSLWDFTKRRVIENEPDDISSLRTIFLNLIELYNKGQNQAEFILILPKEGEKYDNEKHYIHGTKTDGNVKETELEGFINTKTNKIYKAIISVI